MDSILTALLGFTAGVAGSLIAPWVHWGIEKKRSKLQARRELMSKWKTLIYDVSKFKVQSDKETENMVFKELIQKHPSYYTLEPHLAADTISAIESTPNKFWEHPDVVTAFQKVVRDVNNIEKRWNLI